MLKRLSIFLLLAGLLPAGAMAQGICPTSTPVGQVMSATSYTLKQTDYCNSEVFTSNSPIAVSLPAPGTAGGFQLGYWTRIFALGSGTVTVTPAKGPTNTPKINGTTTLAISTGNSATIYQGTDGNWYANLGSSGGSGFTITDGTNTVASTSLLSVTGGVVGGTTPNATLTITGGAGTACGTNGVAGQVCNSTGGSAAAWGSEVLGRDEADGGPDAVVITAGNATTSAGGGVTITGGSAVSFNSGNVTIVGGANDNHINGGKVTIKGGAGNASNFVAGGDVEIISGAGDGSGALAFSTPNANGAGSISIVAGDSATGTAPNVTITGGSGGGNNQGSVVALEAKGSAGSGVGGTLTIQADASNTVGSGAININSSFSPTTNDGGLVSIVGHVVNLPGTNSLLALSSCGTGTPTVSSNSNDHGGTITIGGGSVTACTLTFAHPWTGLTVGNPAPYCVANSAGGTTPVAMSISAISTTAVTFAAASDLNGAGVGGKISYMCGY